MPLPNCKQKLSASIEIFISTYGLRTLDSDWREPRELRPECMLCRQSSGLQCTACNDCPLINVPNEELLAICTSGEVPVLSCTLHGLGILNIKVIASPQCSSFLAIPHVWSDGLGNDTANALYHCQLIDVIRQVRHLRNSLDADASSGSSGSLIPLELNTPSSHSILFNEQTMLFWLDTLCIALNGRARKSAIECIA